jgi:hypothetical protein
MDLPGMWEEADLIGGSSDTDLTKEVYSAMRSDMRKRAMFTPPVGHELVDEDFQTMAIEGKVPFPEYNEAGINVNDPSYEGDDNQPVFDHMARVSEMIDSYESRLQAAKLLNGSGVLGLDTSLEDYCEAITEFDHFLRTGEYVIDDGV